MDFLEGIGSDAFGIPTGDVDAIRHGVLNDFVVDHYISRKLGIDRTTVWSMFVVPPGQKSVAEIIGETTGDHLILDRASIRPWRPAA
jgi:PmbA protein